MGVSGQLHVLATILKRKYPPVPSEWEVDWAPERVRKLWKRDKSLVLARN